MSTIAAKSYLFEFIARRAFVAGLRLRYRLDPASTNTLCAMIEDLEWLCSVLSSAPEYVFAGPGSTRSISQRLRQLKVEGDRIAEDAINCWSQPLDAPPWHQLEANHLALLANRYRYVNSARNDN